jgi:hypothetical protein
MFFEGPLGRNGSDEEIDGVGAGPEAPKARQDQVRASFRAAQGRANAGAKKTAEDRIRQIEAGVWPPKVSPEDDREMHHSSQTPPARTPEDPDDE